MNKTDRVHVLRVVTAQGVALQVLAHRAAAMDIAGDPPEDGWAVEFHVEGVSRSPVRMASRHRLVDLLLANGGVGFSLDGEDSHWWVDPDTLAQVRDWMHQLSGVRYPIRHRGQLVWACCVSRIGPDCAHVAQPVH